MPTIVGKIVGPDGQPAARTIRLYRRDTGALIGSATSAAVAVGYGDPSYDLVSLLLPMNGADGTTVFTDLSTSPKTVSASGIAKISTSLSKFGGSSLSLGGSGGLSVASSPSLQFGSADFTIEFWLRTSKGVQPTEYPRILAVGNYLSSGGWNLVYLKPSGAIYLDFYDAGVTTLGMSCGVVDGPAWRHIAITRSGATVRAFLDGALSGSSSATTVLSNTSNFAVGTDSTGSAPFAGNIDDLRITKGVARYVSNFTPPTAPSPTVPYVPPGALGDYGFTTSYVGEVQRVVLDDDAGDLYNDLIDRIYLT